MRKLVIKPFLNAGGKREGKMSCKILVIYTEI
jgi:hypothetical protein